MNTRRFDDFETSIDELIGTREVLPTESSPTTRLERRRRIEDLQEEKMLREELNDYIFLK